MSKHKINLECETVEVTLDPNLSAFTIPTVCEAGLDRIKRFLVEGLHDLGRWVLCILVCNHKDRHDVRRIHIVALKVMQRC